MGFDSKARRGVSPPWRADLFATSAYLTENCTSCQLEYSSILYVYRFDFDGWVIFRLSASMIFPACSVESVVFPLTNA